MANYAMSDPDDRLVWQSIHEAWAKLVNAEMEHRAGRTPDWYREYLRGDGRESYSLATSGSSMSKLTPAQAFERGYSGGW